MKTCTQCRKRVSDNTMVCPICGSETFEVIDKSAIKLNVPALVGFIIGIVSFIFNLFGVIPVIALVFSGIGMVKLQKGDTKGKVFGIIGLISGFFNLFFFLITMIINFTLH